MSKEKKKVKCPECGEKVSHIENIQDNVCTYQLRPNGEYSKPYIESGDGRNDFLTPCGCIEFDCEEDAIAFLKGKKTEWRTVSIDDEEGD